MRAFTVAIVAWVAGTILGDSLLAQSQPQVPVTPAHPTGFKKREINGGSSTGAGLITREPEGRKTITVYYTTVTPMREWTNLAGQVIKAQLLAYSAPEEGEKGPVELIREKKIRFLLSSTKQPVDYELAKLSEADRTYIQKLALLARHQPPVAVKEKRTETAPESKPENP